VVEIIKQVRAANGPPTPSPVAEARSLVLSLAWFNRVMSLDVELTELLGDRRLPNILLAREALATRMKYLGGLSYPDIAQLLRGDRTQHSTVLAAANRVVARIFADGIKPKDEIIATVMRALSEDDWRLILTRIKEARK
jgi:hypothetical protein